MRRLSVTVLAITCFLVGYTIAAYRASASADDIQVRRLPNGVNVGNTVELWFARDTLATGGMGVGCKIADVSGVWIRCTNDAVDSLRRHDWYDLTLVARIVKANK
jgi:hypothetical protein